MARRFLTAEDVQRSGGAEIVVDDATVVTPQALEAAQAAGVVIRTEGGAWHEPEPDRGPDAARAVERSAGLPEPEQTAASASTAIVTAVGRNQAGVLAEITAAIAAERGNVHDISQKVVEGLFHMILTVELDDVTSFDHFKTTLEGMSRPEALAVRVMNERVFRFMHRI